MSTYVILYPRYDLLESREGVSVQSVELGVIEIGFEFEHLQSRTNDNVEDGEAFDRYINLVLCVQTVIRLE